MAKYQDDSFEVIKDDIDRLRKKTTMYISYKGSKGALHLCREAINNAIDEVITKRSPGNKIAIELDSNLNQLTVVDNGRGIPFNEVETICTYLHSGSNIDKEDTKKDAAEFAGENGVGTTAINALSKKLYFIIRRDGKIGTFTFIDGKMQKPTFEKCSSKEHGTAIVFIPDEKYLGKCKIDASELEEWIDAISYTIPVESNIHITYSHIKRGKELPVTKEFYHENGLLDLLDEMAPNKLIKPISITESPDMFLDKQSHVSIVYTIKEGDLSDGTNIRSYCNRVITIDGGTHEQAALSAWSRSLTKIVYDSLSENEKNKMRITAEDCRVGLTTIVVANLPNPGFTGQTKQKVYNKDIYKQIVDNTMKELFDYFSKNPTEKKKVVSIIKSTVKQRQSIIKVRKSDYAQLDHFEAVTSDMYSPCSSKKYAELWIMEGNSAKGDFIGCRDSKFQAAFKLRGNPKNVYGCSLGEILKNRELQALTRVLGCGVGSDFNINKLNFDKIIFFVDSDIDGWNMISLLSAYFLWVMPEVVEAGKVYRAMAPFYILKEAKHKYIISKNEYYEIFANNISKNMHLVSLDGHVFTNNEMKKFVKANRNYLDELDELVKYYACNNEIIEFCIIYGNDPNFKKLLQKKFNELEFDEKTKVISGTYNLTYQYLIMDDLFFNRCNRLIKIINDIDNRNIYYRVIVDNKKSKVISLGTFFMLSRKYLPKVDKRIKGIGELPAKVLWNTTLNPKNRTLTRLTITDLESELETVKMLHGPDTELRKDLMNDYIFNKDDIDT